MRTVDTRILVRDSYDSDSALRHLVSGVLRVHAAVELRPNIDGALVASLPVHRHRDAAHYAEARSWLGRRTGPDEVPDPRDDLDARLARVRLLCVEALAADEVDGATLAQDVLAALSGESP